MYTPQSNVSQWHTFFTQKLYILNVLQNTYYTEKYAKRTENWLGICVETYVYGIPYGMPNKNTS